MKKAGLKDWILLLVIALICGFASRSFLIHASAVASSPDQVAVNSAVVSSTAKDGNTGYAGEQSRRTQNALGNMYILKINEKVKVGNLLVVYRGFDEQGQFKLDVAIPEFDAQAFYPYRFRKKDSKKGIKLANNAFKVLSARRKVLHLQAQDAPIGS